uniref:Large ribosomal subunit protein mL45 n=1 Tax=Sarcophilus harrisii TaxID=9305 RepID=A0A7N4Q258_SARHA
MRRSRVQQAPPRCPGLGRLRRKRRIASAPCLRKVPGAWHPRPLTSASPRILRPSLGKEGEKGEGRLAARPGKFHSPARPHPFVPARARARSPPPPYSRSRSRQPSRAQHGGPHKAKVLPPGPGSGLVFSPAGIFDAYIPPEGDARLTSLSKAGLKQKTENLKQGVISQLAIRKLREYDADFRVKTFPEKAQQIFVEAHQCLNTSDHDRLHALATERCFPEMVWDLRLKTVRWSFVESLEPPRVVHVRCPNMVNEGNLYGQVTVRMHTRQTLAIYDRFGRLMYGQEDVPKDVLEYVVFERHLTNPYGTWRMHGKIVPAWAPSKEPIPKTMMIPGPKLEPWEEYEEKNVDIQKPQPVQ